LLNGLRFGVTENPHTALRWLRKETDKWRVWIDAICVNQEDIDERNQQVLLMRRIYETAEQGIV
jgi:Heterokaryon incompatibility protein (HET)